MQYFKLEATPFRMCDGELLMFGFPLFGGWLPYVGFKRVEYLKTFYMEWFLRGIVYVYGVDEDYDS